MVAVVVFLSAGLPGLDVDIANLTSWWWLIVVTIVNILTATRCQTRGFVN